jgi:hypothetical protein
VLKRSLNDWETPMSHADRIGKAELLVDLYSQDRLWVGLSSGYEAAAYAYAVAGDEQNTKRWASKAVDSLLLLWGDAPDMIGDMEELMLRPTAHRTWKWRHANETSPPNI